MERGGAGWVTGVRTAPSRVSLAGRSICSKSFVMPISVVNWGNRHHTQQHPHTHTHATVQPAVMSTGAVATPPAKRAPHLRLGSFNASLLVRQFDTCRVQRLGTCIELLLRPMKLGRRLIQSRLTLRLHACLSL